MPEDALPRPTRDPERLLRLRDQALARMALDEAAVAPQRVTRRWFTLAAGAAIAAPRAFALRNPAAQYGAPGLPGNPPLPQPVAFASRIDLGSLDSWSKSSVALIEEHSPKDSIYSDGHQSRTAYYRLPSGEPLSLNLVTASSTSYVVGGPAAFYVSYAGDLYGGEVPARRSDPGSKPVQDAVHPATARSSDTSPLRSMTGLSKS